MNTAISKPPEHFELLEGYACFKPIGAPCLSEVVRLISQAVAYAYDHKIPRLLVNTSGLTGIYQPTIMQRYDATREWASQARGFVKAALFARREVIDLTNFGDSVAFNAGLCGKAFTSEAEALAWLLDDETG
ncbi:hypothetical protein [Pedosphaera parvula]|nr:hypothetical protein [Pedosphaera parvula]